MPEVTSQWARNLEGNILEFIQDGYQEHSDWTPEIFQVTNRTEGITRYEDMFGPASVPESAENVATPEAQFQSGFETITRPLIFKQKMGATEEMTAWNRYQNTLDRARSLGEAAIQTINRYGANVFINAFSTSFLEYGDNKPLASTAHTRANGGTAESNASTNSIALTEANLETGMVALRQQKSGTGRKLAIGNGNITLMVPEQLDKEARIITGSNLRSGTPNNDLNWYKGFINVFVNPFIGSDMSDLNGNSGTDTQWHLIVKGVHRLKFNWDMRTAFKTWEDDDFDTMWAKVKFRVKATWADYRGTYHSKGDATSYTD